MKKENYPVRFLFIGSTGFQGSEKNLYDENVTTEKEKKMIDLEVPADFDWKGSQNAKSEKLPINQLLLFLYF